MDFKESMKQEFEQIIQHHKVNGEMHSKLENDVRIFINYLLGQTSYVKKRLHEVIQHINYETIQRHEEFNVWPKLEFWRGVDDYGSSVDLSYGSSIENLKDEAPVVYGQYEDYSSVLDSSYLIKSMELNDLKIDTKRYPISSLGNYYYFNYSALFYAWMANIWQEVEGYKCGLKVRLVENSSNWAFSLNDFLEGGLSEFSEDDYGEKPKRLKNFFSRKLSLVEVYLRITKAQAPLNTFKNAWRYFEKENQFIEVGVYNSTTGIRSGNISNQRKEIIKNTIQHENPQVALKHIFDFTNQMINEGWEEKFRPLEMPKRVAEHAIDLPVWHLQINLIEKSAIENFESKFDIKLPATYFQYLRVTNGIKDHNQYHPIDEVYTIQLKEIYSLEKLSEIAESTLITDPNHLWIGELVDNQILGIVINSAIESYGNIVIKSDQKIKKCDYNFEKFIRHPQSYPKQPEIFAAEENDAAFLEMRIKEGWDYNTSYQYQRAVSVAAEQNSHEALEVLLKAGAIVKYNKNVDRTFDEKTIQLIHKYVKDE